MTGDPDSRPSPAVVDGGLAAGALAVVAWIARRREVPLHPGAAVLGASGSLALEWILGRRREAVRRWWARPSVKAGSVLCLAGGIALGRRVDEAGTLSAVGGGLAAYLALLAVHAAAPGGDPGSEPPGQRVTAGSAGPNRLSRPGHRSPAMRIRDATTADAEAVREVHRESIEGLGPEAYSQEQVDAWAAGCESADYAAAIEAGEAEFVVAEREGGDGTHGNDGADGNDEGDGDVVGFGSLKLATPEEYAADVDAEVTGVYVHPSVARDGVGTRLYGELERRARDHGVGTLGLWASRNAVPFYEVHGYERVAEHDHEFSAHESTGVTGVVVEMVKEL